MQKNSQLRITPGERVYKPPRCVLDLQQLDKRIEAWI